MKHDKLRVIAGLYDVLLASIRIERNLVLATFQESEMEQTTTDLIVRLNTSTNKIATKIQTLIDQAAEAGSVTAAEVNAALTPVVEQLEAMGADPANPFPSARS